MDDKTVRELIQYACDCNGCSYLADEIPVKWSNRMTSSMGIASWRSGKGYYITFSIPLFARGDENDCWQTVIHEACHIIDGVINQRRMSHGDTWAACMRKCGCEPERCHTVSNAGLVKRFIYECPNGCREFALSTRMHNQVNRGRYRICGRCKTRVVWTGRIEGGQ